MQKKIAYLAYVILISSSLYPIEPLESLVQQIQVLNQENARLKEQLKKIENEKAQDEQNKELAEQTTEVTQAEEVPTVEEKTEKNEDIEPTDTEAKAQQEELEKLRADQRKLMEENTKLQSQMNQLEPQLQAIIASLKKTTEELQVREQNDQDKADTQIIEQFQQVFATYVQEVKNLKQRMTQEQKKDEDFFAQSFASLSQRSQSISELAQENAQEYQAEIERLKKNIANLERSIDQVSQEAGMQQLQIKELTKELDEYKEKAKSSTRQDKALERMTETVNQIIISLQSISFESLDEPPAPVGQPEYAQQNTNVSVLQETTNQLISAYQTKLSDYENELEAQKELNQRLMEYQEVQNQRMIAHQDMLNQKMIDLDQMTQEKMQNLITSLGEALKAPEPEAT